MGLNCMLWQGMAYRWKWYLLHFTFFHSIHWWWCAGHQKQMASKPCVTKSSRKIKYHLLQMSMQIVKRYQFPCWRPNDTWEINRFSIFNPAWMFFVLLICGCKVHKYLQPYAILTTYSPWRIYGCCQNRNEWSISNEPLSHIIWIWCHRSPHYISVSLFKANTFLFFFFSVSIFYLWFFFLLRTTVTAHVPNTENEKWRMKKITN